MKYQEFAELCLREYVKDGGDLTALNLTPASAAELAIDVLCSPDPPNLCPPRITCDFDVTGPFGAAITRGINPVTQSAVSVSRDAAADTATVVYGPLHAFTRTVAITPAAAAAADGTSG